MVVGEGVGVGWLACTWEAGLSARSPKLWIVARPTAISAAAMLLEQAGHEHAARRILNAIQIVTGTKMKSQAAGQMGYGTTEIGDLVVEALEA